MKRYLMLFLLFATFSCDNDTQENSVPFTANEIIGSWQIVSESYSIGGPQIGVEVENGAIYNFSLDGTFTLKKGDDNSLVYSGSYTLLDELLRIDFLLEGKELYWELKTSLQEGRLTWFPVGPTICIEGCSTTLQKVQ